MTLTTANIIASVMMWVWSIGEMILTEQKQTKLGENPVSASLCISQISHGTARNRTRDSAVRGRWLTLWTMGRLVNWDGDEVTTSSPSQFTSHMNTNKNFAHNCTNSRYRVLPFSKTAPYCSDILFPRPSSFVNMTDTWVVAAYSSRYDIITSWPLHTCLGWRKYSIILREITFLACVSMLYKTH